MKNGSKNLINKINKRFSELKELTPMTDFAKGYQYGAVIELQKILLKLEEDTSNDIVKTYEYTPDSNTMIKAGSFDASEL